MKNLVTKLRLYETCFQSVLLYCSESWTLLKADVNRLPAFHMRSLRRTLGIRWFDYVTNAEVKDRTRLDDMEPRIRRRRLALFGHVARMQPGVPAHDALWTVLVVRCDSVPDTSDPAGGLRPPGLSNSGGTLMAWASGRLSELSGYGQEWLEGVCYEPLLLTLEMEIDRDYGTSNFLRKQIFCSNNIFSFISHETY